MFANERYDIIIGLIKKHRSVTVSELCERFGVSIETVRRDLAYLEKARKLTRVHGGAIALSDKNVSVTTLSERIDDNTDKKRELSEYAMKFICEGDVIAIDAGSTAMVFVSVLCEHFKSLTVVTNSTDVTEYVSKNSGFKLIFLGGTYFASEKCCYGYMAESAMDMLHADKCFIFPSAISLRYGGTTYIGECVGVELRMINASDKYYILADSSKFETNSSIRITELAKADAVITDSALDKRICELYRENGVKLINHENERGTHK